MLRIEDRGYMVLIWENLLDWYDEETETLYDSAPIRFENGRIEAICDDFLAIEKEEGFVLYIQNGIGEVENILSTDGELMSVQEAAELWGLEESTIRKRIKDFPEGTKRRIGKQWIVTKKGMVAVFGNPRKKQPFVYREVEFCNIDVLKDFLKTRLKTHLAQRLKNEKELLVYLDEIMHKEGSYELPSYETRSGNPENIYFHREDEVDEETGEIKTIIRF